MLDILFWFGPRLRLKMLMGDDVREIIQMMRQISLIGTRPLWDLIAKTTAAFFDQYNLISQLSAFPIGIPSLLGGQALLRGKAPIDTPFGLAPVIEIQSSWLLLCLWLALSLAGLTLGVFFFSLIAHSCVHASRKSDSTGAKNILSPAHLPPLRLSVILWQAVQMVALLFIFIIAILAIILPAFWISFYLFVVSPFFTVLVFGLASFSLIWMLIPFIFSPHGVFLNGQSLFHAMVSSMRVVRLSFTETSVFLLAALILYQGLGILWLFPTGASWLTGIGILGHAFIATGLLASSFIYYQRGLNYVQTLRNMPFPGKTA